MQKMAVPILMLAASLLSSGPASSDPYRTGLPPCPPDADPPGDGSCDPLAFSDGNRIRKEDGGTIDPRSHEGRQIEDILARQRREAEENAAQGELLWRMTHAKDAAGAESILQEAREKDSNAGTPNRIFYTGRKSPQRQDAETVRLREALAALNRGENLSAEQQALVQSHFPEGVMFMSQDEYHHAVMTAPETLKQGVVTVEPTGRVDIHTKVGVRSTNGGGDDESYRFPDGRLYNRKDGTPIKPDDRAGQKIIGMLEDHQARVEPEAERGARLAGAKAAPSPKKEIAAERAASWKATRGDPAFTFSNGNQIRRKGGAPIHTDSVEGKQIEAILERQRRDRVANEAQSELYWRVTRAKNAHEALAILKTAKEKDPNAGTKNTYYKKK